MKLSIVIATRNRLPMLRRTLPALFAQQFAPSEYEIVIADDGSTDGTADYLRAQTPACGWQMLALPHRGISAARNAAIKSARGEIILLLDDDILCPPGLFGRHVLAHVGSSQRVVIGPLTVALSTRSVAGEYMRRITERYNETLATGVVWPLHAVVDPNTSLPRALALAVGNFDENIAFREGPDLGLRLWALGTQFLFESSACATHIYEKRARSLVRTELRAKGQNEVSLCRKHPAIRGSSPIAARRGLRGGLLRSVAPFAVAPLLTAGAISAEILHATGLRRSGARVLSACLACAQLRGAARSCGGWREFDRAYGRLVPVLCYHRVGPEAPGTFASLTVSPLHFRAQMDWLASHGYTGIAASDWIAWRAGDRELPAKPVILTFDDAYAETAEHALPLLRARGWRATVFTVTGAIGGTNHWDQPESAPLHLMKRDDILRWHAAGIEFAPHGRTHRDLTLLNDAELSDEIGGSARDLEALLGTAATSFAYPYGTLDTRVHAAAERHIMAAFTVHQRRNGLGDDAHDLRRTMVRPTDSLMTFAARVCWGMDPAEVVRNYLRGSWARRLKSETAAPPRLFSARASEARAGRHD